MADPGPPGDPVEVIRRAIGVEWSRTFRQFPGMEDGTTVWVDTATGLMYDVLPDLNPTDGIPDTLPRKK